MELVAFALLGFTFGLVFYAAKYKFVFGFFSVALFGYTSVSVTTIGFQLAYFIFTSGSTDASWVTQTTLPFLVFGFIFDLATLGNELLGRGSVCVVASQAMFATRLQKTASASLIVNSLAWILFGIVAIVVGGLFTTTKRHRNKSKAALFQETTGDLFASGTFF